MRHPALQCICQHALCLGWAPRPLEAFTLPTSSPWRWNRNAQPITRLSMLGELNASSRPTRHTVLCDDRLCNRLVEGSGEGRVGCISRNVRDDERCSWHQYNDPYDDQQLIDKTDCRQQVFLLWLCLQTLFISEVSRWVRKKRVDLLLCSSPADLPAILELAHARVVLARTETTLPVHNWSPAEKHFDRCGGERQTFCTAHPRVIFIECTDGSAVSTPESDGSCASDHFSSCCIKINGCIG
mmetsp:Transcript_34007/g.56303  ORF Transcript_34007/g.56303 Transcript_34007/m.56303 type:complete len:241 (-) Transcript_34007:143-865(-)